MTTSAIRILSLLAAAGLLHPLCAAEPPTATTQAFDKITYQDSGGFSGGGSGKSLILTFDGKLEVKSRAGQAKTVQLEEQELAELKKAVTAVDWTTIKESYSSQGADMFVNGLTIVIAGKIHQTSGDEQAKLPPELKKLFKQLDDTYRRATTDGNSKNRLPKPGTVVVVDPVIKAGEKVIIKGKLNGGLIAIGGETTGWVLTYKNSKGAAEVEVNMEAIKEAESFDGAEVTVSGTIILQPYIERGPVLILKADTVRAAKISPEPDKVDASPKSQGESPQSPASGRRLI